MIVALLKKLLNNFAFHSPAILSKEEAEKHPKELEVLLSLGILQQDTFPQERWCPSCESESLPIQVVSKDRAFTLCTRDETAGRDYFDPQTLTQWQFNLPRLLELVAKELKIKGDVKNVVANDLWLIGTLQKDGRHFLIFYSRTNDISSHSKFLDAFKSPVRAFVIFTNTETPLINLERAETVVVPIADMVELKKNTLVWDAKSFQEHILTAFRQVVFYPTNGDVMLNGKVIGGITPSTPEYFFTLILWQNFNQPVSHSDIFSYCKEQLGKEKDYEDTHQAFCYKMKSNIKKQIKNCVVDKVIVSTKALNGSNAYKMTNPK